MPGCAGLSAGPVFLGVHAPIDVVPNVVAILIDRTPPPFQFDDLIQFRRPPRRSALAVRGVDPLALPLPRCLLGYRPRFLRSSVWMCRSPLICYRQSNFPFDRHFESSKFVCARTCCDPQLFAVLSSRLLEPHAISVHRDATRLQSPHYCIDTASLPAHGPSARRSDAANGGRGRSLPMPPIWPT